MNRRAFLGGLAALLAAPVLAKVAPAAPVPANQPVNPDGWGHGATSLKRGDIITIAGVYAVNPLTGRETDRLQTFAVIHDMSPGDTVVTVSPDISPGKRQVCVDAVTPWRTRPLLSISKLDQPVRLVAHRSRAA